MAYCGDLAPCSPRRISSICSRTNSPACVLGDLPARLSCLARRMASFFGTALLRSKSRDGTEATHRMMKRSREWNQRQSRLRRGTVIVETAKADRPPVGLGTHRPGAVAELSALASVAGNMPAACAKIRDPQRVAHRHGIAEKREQLRRIGKTRRRQPEPVSFQSHPARIATADHVVAVNRKSLELPASARSAPKPLSSPAPQTDASRGSRPVAAPRRSYPASRGRRDR